MNFPQNFKIAASYRNLFCLSNNVCLVGYSGLSNSLYHVSCLLSCLIVKRILSIKNSFLLYCGNDWKTRKRNLLLIFFSFYFTLFSLQCRWQLRSLTKHDPWSSVFIFVFTIFLSPSFLDWTRSFFFFYISFTQDSGSWEAFEKIK